MIKNSLVGSIFLLLLACSQTENGWVLGTPDYEQRDIHVSAVDLAILERAKALISQPQMWSKSHSVECSRVEQYTLYCALEKSTTELKGQYIHRQAALQEVRFVIDDQYKSRWKKHRLMDFNSHPETQLEDVLWVIDQATTHVEKKLAAQL